MAIDNENATSEDIYSMPADLLDALDAQETDDD